MATATLPEGHRAARISSGSARVHAVPEGSRLTLCGKNLSPTSSIVDTDTVDCAACVRDIQRASADAIEPTSVVRPSEDPYAPYEGVRELIDLGAKTAREGAKHGKALVNVAERLAEINLDMRLRIINPDTGLPDLTAAKGVARNAARDLYTKAQADMDEDDADTKEAYEALKRAARNYMTDKITNYMRALDENESEVRRYFPAALEIRDQADGEMPLSEAVYRLYEEKGISLPRRTRAELMREQRQRKKLEDYRRALETATDPDQIRELREEIDALSTELGEPPQKERRDDERLAEQIHKARSLVEAATKGAKKLPDEERARLKSELQELVTALAAAAGEL